MVHRMREHCIVINLGRGWGVKIHLMEWENDIII